MSTKDDQLIFRCFECKKIIIKISKKIYKRFANIYKFRDGDINNFILLLRKGVYSYEYIYNWERFEEIFLPDKEIF